MPRVALTCPTTTTTTPLLAQRSQGAREGWAASRVLRAARAGLEGARHGGWQSLWQAEMPLADRLHLHLYPGKPGRAVGGWVDGLGAWSYARCRRAGRAGCAGEAAGMLAGSLQACCLPRAACFGSEKRVPYSLRDAQRKHLGAATLACSPWLAACSWQQRRRTCERSGR